MMRPGEHARLASSYDRRGANADHGRSACLRSAAGRCVIAEHIGTRRDRLDLDHAPPRGRRPANGHDPHRAGRPHRARRTAHRRGGRSPRGAVRLPRGGERAPSLRRRLDQGPDGLPRTHADHHLAKPRLRPRQLPDIRERRGDHDIRPQGSGAGRLADAASGRASSRRTARGRRDRAQRARRSRPGRARPPADHARSPPLPGDPARRAGRDDVRRPPDRRRAARRALRIGPARPRALAAGVGGHRRDLQRVVADAVPLARGRAGPRRRLGDPRGLGVAGARTARGPRPQRSRVLPRDLAARSNGAGASVEGDGGERAGRPRGAERDARRPDLSAPAGGTTS